MPVIVASNAHVRVLVTVLPLKGEDSSALATRMEKEIRVANHRLTQLSPALVK